ncbi:MAG: endonuclease III [Phycisphaerae bacterium]|nr:endonuclease III [Phycisphaerae bacterium]
MRVIRTFRKVRFGAKRPYFATVPARNNPTRAAKKAPGDRFRRLAEALRARYPDAHCALEHRNAFELLIATILSAQTTDVAVNKVTPALFRAYPDAKALSRAAPEDLEPFLRTIGLFRNKSKSISGTARMLEADYGGEVPRTMRELIRLPGVARKTANVVLGNSFGINEGFVVDTHIARLAVRFGIAEEGDDVAAIERKLMAAFPREKWCELSHQLIWHGRAVCKARGGTCETDGICAKFGVGCPKRKDSVKPASRSRAVRGAPAGPNRRR